MLQDGYLGLVEANEKYTEESGVCLDAFAYKRIKGAIMDGMRRMSWESKNVAANRMRMREAVYEAGEHGSVADILGMSQEEFRIFQANTMVGCAIDTDSKIDHVPNLDKDIQCRQRIEAAYASFDILDDRKRLVMKCRYIEGMKNKEIAAVFGVSEAMTSELHSEAMQSIKKHISRKYREMI